MDINKDNYFKIFEKNMLYEIVETPVGKAIKMSSRDAFIYSNVSGAGYLDNPVYPFTPKGLLKLFYNAFDYKFVTGIFDNTTLKNTPFILSQAKPFLFKGTKYIIPVEFTSESQLNDYLNEIHGSLCNPEDYIIQRIEASKIGNGMEPLMEYFAAEYFKNKGYIVENQIPLAHAIGSPDFGGYGLSDFIKAINEFGFLPRNGFHIIELAMIRLNRALKNTSEHSDTSSLLVGEAKTGTSVISKQLMKYLNTGLFDAGYEIRPFKKAPAKRFFGLITINDSFKIQVLEPQEDYVPSKMLSKDDYLVWLKNYVKFYLLANLTNDELNNFYFQKCQKRIAGQADIVSFVMKTDIEEILMKIKEL